jgi:hypothetical protein
MPPPTSTGIFTAAISAAMASPCAAPPMAGIQVDDVQPLGTLRFPAARGLGRIRSVHGLLVRGAAEQADHAPAAHVDRRQDRHAPTSARTDAT